MPGIGSLICEIAVEFSEMWESKHDFCSVKPMPRVLSVKFGLMRWYIPSSNPLAK